MVLKVRGYQSNKPLKEIIKDEFNDFEGFKGGVGVSLTTNYHVRRKRIFRSQFEESSSLQLEFTINSQQEICRIESSGTS